MATISLPASFFRSELRLYNQWTEAVARELVQNSHDAGATHAEATVTTGDNGKTRVVFTDNGCGMTRAVLEDVFFALGETTKTSSDSVGGFGRARIILCFAQDSYTVHTGNLMVTGSGGEYHITEAPFFHQGCIFTINTIDDDADRFTERFFRVLRTCTLTMRVTVNGRTAPGLLLPARAAKVMRTDGGRVWARTYINTSGGGYLHVRAGGLTMYSSYTGTYDTVVLELSPSMARAVLTASRDSLRQPYSSQVDAFVLALSNNRRAALSSVVNPLDVLVSGGGFLATDSPTVEVSAEVDEPVGVTAGAFLTTVTADNDRARSNTDVGDVPKADHHHADEPHSVSLTGHHLGFDAFLIANNRDARVRKLLRSWDPTQWGERTGVRRRALLLAWKSVVGLCLDSLTVSHPELGRVVWTVGWVLDPDVQALHTTRNGAHVLVLNPVNSEGHTAYSLRLRASRQRLLAVALHEVAHVVAAGHNESFASVLTELTAVVDPFAADRAIRAGARMA